MTFARFVARGIVPNVFPGAGAKPDDNTVDATLWFFEAWRAYIEASGDGENLAAVPGGAPSQAWSVACVIEAWWRLQRALAASKR